MKKLILLPLLVLMIAVQAQNSVTLFPEKARDTISRHIYGHFAEHLGRCIYDGIYVGEDNKTIPHKNGIRLDIVQALKKLKVPVLRWPGGCFADTYHWMDGIGPKAQRPSMLNIWWGNTREDNSFGTHEFLNFCEEIGAEPYLSGNVGSGTPQELADWVKYTTHPNGSSPLADLRQTNGRATPWKVKFWGLGNEAWGCGGNMTADYYANVYRQYATFMTNWNNSDGIYRIASGASGDDYNWTEVLMKNVPQGMFDALGLHHYSVISWTAKGPAAQFTEEQYFKTMKEALKMEELVSRHSAIMDKYDPAKKKALAVDEWGGWYDVEPGTNSAFLYQQNTMRDAVLAGSTLNIFNNHSDRVKMANLAQMVNVLQAVMLTKEEKLILTPTYHVMEMYNVHQDAVMIPLEVRTDKFIMGQDTLNAINASASRASDGSLHISIVNVDSRQAKTIDLRLGTYNYPVTEARVLQSGRIQDHNDFEHPDRVKPAPFKGYKQSGNQLSLTLPPASVVVFTLKGR
ncbi:MAG: alpha-L-arabinofuranosidase C-terminal domain-containing protein [Chitinophagaceae bacterium]|nr:alpha-L-arabinofuranosidase C-terminal domain-containing protein [Chitinophagaceae bacterium]